MVPKSYRNIELAGSMWRLIKNSNSNTGPDIAMKYGGVLSNKKLSIDDIVFVISNLAVNVVSDGWEDNAWNVMVNGVDAILYAKDFSTEYYERIGTI